MKDSGFWVSAYHITLYTWYVVLCLVEAVRSGISWMQFNVASWMSASICPCITWRRGRIRWESTAASLGPSSTTAWWHCDVMPASEPDYLPRGWLLVTLSVLGYFADCMFHIRPSVRFPLSLSRCCRSTSLLPVAWTHNSLVSVVDFLAMSSIFASFMLLLLVHCPVLLLAIMVCCFGVQ